MPTRASPPGSPGCFRHAKQPRFRLPYCAAFAFLRAGCSGRDVNGGTLQPYGQGVLQILQPVFRLAQLRTRQGPPERGRKTGPTE